MQSVLKLMPDPIQEVPSDGSRQQSGGAQDRGAAGEFNSVYEQELYENRSEPRQTNPDSGGKEEQSMRQSDAQQQRIRDKAVRDDADNALAIKQDDKSKELKVSDKLAQPEGKADGNTKIELAKPVKALDQLLDVVENAPKMLRQNNGVAVGEPHGEQALAAHIARQSTLSAAIDSALVQNDGKKVTLEDIVKGHDKAGALEKAKAEAASQAKGQQGTSSNTGQATIGVNHGGTTYDIGDGDANSTATDPKNQGTSLLNNGDKVNSHLTLAASKARDPSLPNSPTPIGQGQPTKTPPTLDDIATPGIASFNDEELNNKFIRGNGKLDAIQTADINPKGDVSQQKQGLGTEGPSMQKADTINQSDKGQVKTEKPFELADEQVNKPTLQTVVKPGAGDKNIDPHQTPGIATPTFEDLAKKDGGINRPFELANQNKPSMMGNNLAQNSQLDTKPMTAPLGTADYQTKPKADKADKPFIGATGNVDKKNANILGKPTGAKIAPDAPIQTDSGKVAQEPVVNERKLMEAILAQNNQQQDTAIVDDKLKSMMPKEMVASMANKVFNPFSASTNSFAQSNDFSLNTTTASKALDKATSKLTEALNITRPDFSANMKERLVVMMNKGVQTADIRLDPAELGQMQVKMSVENDVTSVSIVVQNAQAKEALDQSMPKLREMLAEQGIEMGEGSVEQQEKEQQELGERQSNGDGHMNGETDEDEQEIDALAAQQVKITNGALGGIDFFA